MPTPLHLHPTSRRGAKWRTERYLPWRRQGHLHHSWRHRRSLLTLHQPERRRSRRQERPPQLRPLQPRRRRYTRCTSSRLPCRFRRRRSWRQCRRRRPRTAPGRSTMAFVRLVVVSLRLSASARPPPRTPLSVADASVSVLSADLFYIIGCVFRGRCALLTWSEMSMRRKVGGHAPNP